jgi:hypothetical protein
VWWWWWWWCSNLPKNKVHTNPMVLVSRELPNQTVENVGQTEAILHTRHPDFEQKITVDLAETEGVNTTLAWVVMMMCWADLTNRCVCLPS